MRIVVDPLPGMRPGYICVAGINRAGRQYIRPVLAGGAQLPVGLAGGVPFAIGAQVEIVPATPTGGVPEVEDHVFDPARTTNQGTVAPNEFWAALEDMAKPNLAAVFGPEMHPQSNGCAVDEGHGTASLGALVPATRPTISVNNFGKIRLAIRDAMHELDLSVTDLRLYRPDQTTASLRRVENIQRRIGEGVDVILSVGLARAYKARNDTVRRHWLQVNGVHLRDDPTWQG